MKELLINVFFLLVVLLITQHLVEVYTKRLTQKVITMFAFISGLISIFFCMTFPFSVHEGFNIDIRVVPFVIASLYGGPLTSFGLYLFIVLYRFVLGVDLGLWGTIINYGIIPFVTLAIYQYFKMSSLNKKILIAISVVFLHLLSLELIYQFIFISNTPHSIHMWGGFIKVACILFLVVAIERISSSYHIRKQLMNLEKMEMVSHLSASISHEIRNGLTGTKGFLQLLRESENDPTKSRYIGIALGELERTEVIIRDFLTFAKPSPEKVERVNMEQLLDYIIEVISPLANMNSVEVNKRLSPFWIEGEKRIIQQAFLNIIKNSIEAMPNGGQLEIVMQPATDTYKVIIKDSGVGMDAEQIERLGKPYFSTKGQKGTGLGMMVAFRVIEELQGEIKVKSQLGKGTTFTIHLPYSLNTGEEAGVDRTDTSMELLHS